MYALAILIILITTFFIPLIVWSVHKKYFPNITLHKAPVWLPILAGVLFLISFSLPNINISDQTTTFQQHFVGGGFYITCLYVYMCRLLGWKPHWFIAIIALFVWTSAFGVANEIIEFLLTQFKLANIGTGDTDWDLLANTSGSFVAFLLLLLTRTAKVKKRIIT